MIGERLRKAREARGWSQSALARRAGLTPGHINQIESGHRANPNSETIEALVQALGVSADWLLGREEGEPSGTAPDDLRDLPPDFVRDLVRLPPWMRDRVAGYIRALMEADEEARRPGPKANRSAKQQPHSEEVGVLREQGC